MHAELEVNGVRVHYRMAGESGPVLTLLHGGWLSSKAWDPQLAVLASDCRVLAPDIRGYGRSDHPKEPWSVADCATDLLALWDALDIERSCLLGFSMGGLIALEVATRASERIDGLILVSTTARFGEDVRSGYLAAAADFGPDQYEAALARHLEVAFTPSFRAEHPDVMAEYERDAREIPLWSMRNTMLALAGADHVEALPTIDVPTLVVHGTADQVTGGQHPAMLVAGLPDVRERELEGAGHTLHFDHPDEFTEIVADFVEEVKALS